MPVSITNPSIKRPCYVNIDPITAENTVEFWFTSKPTEYTPDTLPDGFYLKWDSEQSRPLLKRYAKHVKKAPEPILNPRTEKIWDALLNSEDVDTSKEDAEFDKLIDRAFEESMRPPSDKLQTIPKMKEATPITSSFNEDDSFSSKSGWSFLEPIGKLLSIIFGLIWASFGIGTFICLLELNLPFAIVSAAISVAAYGLAKACNRNFD